MKQQINEKIRVAICPHTKKPVLQQYVKWEEQSSWLCLHNENEKKDADEVLKEADLEEEPAEAESENSQDVQLKFCPVCGAKVNLIPAGVSKKTGKSYGAFYSCSSRGCGFTKNLE